ncbi:hypothetical protein Tco_1468036 [Tanacetum coccineum]
MSFSTRVILTTSVSRPQLKSNRLEDRVMHNNSQGKKQEVEDHHRNFKFLYNKTSVTASNDSLNAKTSNVNVPIVVPISTREHKRTMNQSIATPLKRTVASESTNQKHRHTIRKLYEHVLSWIVLEVLFYVACIASFAKVGFEGRATLLEKESYVSWASRFLANRKEEGKLIRYSIDNGLLGRRKVQDPKDPSKEIDELVKDLSVEDKERYYTDIKVMNYILQGIPNDIYNYVDACQDAKAMWNRVGRLMQGTNLSEKERHSRLMNENHDPLTLVANSYAIPSYSRSPQPYYVTHPPSVHDYDDDYQGEIQDQLEELNASVIMMAHIQPTDNKSNAEPTYDVGVISEHITIDDQLDSDIIFDDPYVEVNSGQVEHDQDAPD